MYVLEDTRMKLTCPTWWLQDHLTCQHYQTWATVVTGERYHCFTWISRQLLAQNNYYWLRNPGTWYGEIVIVISHRTEILFQTGIGTPNPCTSSTVHAMPCSICRNFWSHPTTDNSKQRVLGSTPVLATYFSETDNWLPTWGMWKHCLVEKCTPSVYLCIP